MECQKNTVKMSPFNEGIHNKGKKTLRIKYSGVAPAPADIRIISSRRNISRLILGTTETHSE